MTCNRRSGIFQKFKGFSHYKTRYLAVVNNIFDPIGFSSTVNSEGIDKQTWLEFGNRVRDVVAFKGFNVSVVYKKNKRF